MSEPTLHQDAEVDHPGLVGARWWQDSVVDPVGRRKALITLLAVGSGVGAVGLLYEACAPTKTDRRKTLQLQREYGWSFGAATETLVFNGVSTEPFDRSRLDRMALELAPRVASHRPFYVQTLFESPNALPTKTCEEEPAPIVPLKSALQPILTDAMKDAFARGHATADALADSGTVLIVDLDGPSAVAFAAAASDRFDPVFLFDNWPHPRAVVPAHLTLAAAAYYQPMLANAAKTGSNAPAMFVLDRQRLAPYRDDAKQFDNRWLARMPGRDALKSLGVTKLGYVTPAASVPWELDDLNDDLVVDRKGGIAILIYRLSTLPTPLPSPPAAATSGSVARPDAGVAASVAPLDGGARASGGRADGGAPASVARPDAAVAAPVGATDGGALASIAPPPLPAAIDYFPTPRRTAYSSGTAGGARPTPADFGTVEIVLSLLEGTFLGVAWSRSGTWNRGSGSSGG